MKKLMKWLIVLAAMLLVIPSASAETAAADTRTISMTAVDVTFTVPEGMLCLTSESSASEFGEWGMSQREFNAYMEEYDVHAMLYDLNTGDSYQISVYAFMEADFDKLTDAEAQTVLDGLKDEMQQGGLDVLTTEWYQGGSCAFAMLETNRVYEDGYVEQSSQYFTNHAEYCVTIVGFPDAEELTDTVRTNTRLLADSLTMTVTAEYTPPEEFIVDAEERNDGYVVLDMPGVKMTFMPLDARYIATRESAANAFSRMGYMQKKAIRDMEEYEIYVMLMDKEQQVEIDVYLYGNPTAKDYLLFDDADLYEWERRAYLEHGWMIEKLDVFRCEEAKFTRAIVNFTDTDGSVYRRLIYYTAINGCEIEIQVFPLEEQALENCAEAVDAFVRAIQFEVTAQ